MLALKFFCLSISFVFFSFALNGQTAPDFSFIDVNGSSQNLYNELDSGKTIVLMFVYEACAPCHFYMPAMQQLYQKWGNGNADVEFWALSDQEDDAALQNYAAELGLNFIFGSIEGGTVDVFSIFEATYDSVLYPTYAVVCNTGEISWDIWPVSDSLQEIDLQLKICNASGVNIQDLENNETSILVYPSPTKHKVFIDISNFKTLLINNVYIFNNLGQLMAKQQNTPLNTIEEQGITVDLEHLLPGIYQLCLFDSLQNKLQCFEVIKQ